ncbi:sortase [Candidatus Gottesmanbacteria bacterium]|nr:sortase [Candidatus Gottesmanbacteria bacterium]
MDKINLIRPRHIESLIVPSEGAVLTTYLPHVSDATIREPQNLKNDQKKVLERVFIQIKAKDVNKKLPTTDYPLKINHPHLPRSLASALVVISLGGIIGPLIPTLRLEAGYMIDQMKTSVVQNMVPSPTLPPSAPTIFDPLVKPDGEKIEPINIDFSVIVPKVGINAAVASNVDPKSEASYLPALAKGVAHASASFLPDQDGTVYLFSHSTNYDWFVKDLNAVFYHLKSLDTGDLIVVVYKNVRYTYRLREKKVVAPNEISYLIPQHGTKTLILQTCWPPGSTAERLLIFADFIESASL